MSSALRRCCPAHTPPGAKLEAAVWRTDNRFFVVYRFHGLKRSNFHEIKGSSFTHWMTVFHVDTFRIQDFVTPSTRLGAVFVPPTPVSESTPPWEGEPRSPFTFKPSKLYSGGHAVGDAASSESERILARTRKAVQDKMDQLVRDAFFSACIKPTLTDEPDRVPIPGWSCVACDLEFDGEEPVARLCGVCRTCPPRKLSDEKRKAVWIELLKLRDAKLKGVDTE